MKVFKLTSTKPTLTGWQLTGIVSSPDKPNRVYFAWGSTRQEAVWSLCRQLGSDGIEADQIKA